MNRPFPNNKLSDFKKISNKIVLIENAEPGFDFLFSLIGLIFLFPLLILLFFKKLFKRSPLWQPTSTRMLQLKFLAYNEIL